MKYSFLIILELEKMGKHRCKKCYKTKKCYKIIEKEPKEKYDVKVRCAPAHQDESADAGEWNLAIFPEPENSSFRPTPNSDTLGQYTVYSNIADNHADFTSIGLGNASEGDLFNTTYTLEVPSVANSVEGFSIYWTELSGTNGNYIKFIQNDLSYEDTLTARIHNTNIVEAGSTAGPSSAEYTGFAFITHEAL